MSYNGTVKHGADIHSFMWQDRARGEVEGALQQRASLPERLCQLLSGQQLSAAVALASATGDVRLASLICQVIPQVLLRHTILAICWPEPT